MPFALNPTVNKCNLTQVRDREDEEHHYNELQASMQERACDAANVDDTKSETEYDSADTSISSDGELNVDCEERFSSRHTNEGAFAYM